jgi:hypothetical protein
MGRNKGRLSSHKADAGRPEPYGESTQKGKASDGQAQFPDPDTDRKDIYGKPMK